MNDQVQQWLSPDGSSLVGSQIASLERLAASAESQGIREHLSTALSALKQVVEKETIDTRETIARGIISAVRDYNIPLAMLRAGFATESSTGDSKRGKRGGNQAFILEFAAKAGGKFEVAAAKVAAEAAGLKGNSIVQSVMMMAKIGSLKKVGRGEYSTK